ncbi:DNA/RNA non-specific endonuclease [Auraticoccus monumenti]|uniref:DNA/RNA non-specific endonuclease n=1 Tax=Auraticoccus monumenti TaxID=675864 RepID=A0A1G6XJU0_9ACTN|nr:DNA/RNA non-specific endonuclease [Auraticoccus monumenti]SDD78053.1 DNA/RNA non-specific endonuclease [Auraticoccus monumenti]
MARGRAAALRGVFGSMLDDVLKVVDTPIKRGTRRLEPNAAYTTGKRGTTAKYHYSTDAQGRIRSAHARPLQLHRGNRASHTNDPMGKRPGDHAGHLIADLFGGSQRHDNIVAQLSSQNLGRYKSMENRWARLLDQTPPAKIDVDIKVLYGPGDRPIGISVTEVVNGRRLKHPMFTN